MLFFFLIGACLSISQNNLQPANSNMPSSNLLSIAKTDPLSLLKMLDGADPTAIENIVTILGSLIADGQKEIKDLGNAIDDAEADVAANKTALATLRKLEGIALAVYDRHVKAENIAKGAWEVAVDELKKAAPGVKKEIGILKKVLSMLQDLLNQNTPQQKDLLELGSSEKGRVYLKLLANVQADPSKLRKIIGFVETLLTGVELELKKLENNVATSRKNYDDATTLRRKAQVALDTAKKNRIAGENALSQAEGELETANDNYNSRQPVIVSEEETLTEVIKLLRSTKDQ